MSLPVRSTLPATALLLGAILSIWAGTVRPTTDRATRSTPTTTAKTRSTGVTPPTAPPLTTPSRSWAPPRKTPGPGGPKDKIQPPIIPPNEAEVTLVEIPGTDPVLIGKLFVPAGTAPYPAVIVMHGSGGLWLGNDPEDGEMEPHFEQWGTTLQAQGYVALFVDSFSPRGIEEFGERRPSSLPDLSDAACSPTHVRPLDAYAALTYLKTQAPVGVMGTRVGLMGFSHGAEAALASVVDDSVVTGKLDDWTVSYVSMNGNQLTTNHNHVVSAPSYPVPNAWGFRCVVAYYPGCGFFGYFGKTSQANYEPGPNQFMPYVPTLMFHGADDSLVQHAPKLVERSQHQADYLGELQQLPPPHDNPLTRIEYPNVEHSFDEAVLGQQSPKGEPWTAADVAARATSEVMTLEFLETHLKVQ